MSDPQHYVLDWRKWGFGFSFELRDPAYLRLWLGPLRVGLAYGHVPVASESASSRQSDPEDS